MDHELPEDTQLAGRVHGHQQTRLQHHLDQPYGLERHGLTPAFGPLITRIWLSLSSVMFVGMVGLPCFWL